MDLDNLQYEELWENLDRYIKENYTGEEVCACCVDYAMEETLEEMPLPTEKPKQTVKPSVGMGSSLQHSCAKQASFSLPPWLRRDSEEKTVCNDRSEEATLKEVESLAELLHRKEITFSEKLFELIDAKELDEVQVYSAARIDRRLFSKLRRRDYQPSKNTVLALIVGMQLNMQEAKELLEYAGYALAPSNKTDIIISFFLERKQKYDVDLVNEFLVKHGQKCLGNVLA